MKLDREQRRAGDAMAAMAQVSVLASTSKPAGTAATTIAMAHPDLLAAFDPAEDGIGIG